MRISYVGMEGPRRGFSLKGWKESLPRYSEKRHLSIPALVDGQSLTYIVYTKIPISAAKMRGMSQEHHGSGATGGVKKDGEGGGGAR